MAVKTITDNESGRKWEIIKNGDGLYSVKYYEFFQSIGWRLTGTDNGYTKDYIEGEFEIEAA